VLLSFVFLSLSGVLLFVSPQGRVAYWSRWTLFGLTKDEYSAVHTTLMILFLVVGIWHTVLNWKPITAYLKNRSRQVRLMTPGFGAAVVLTALFVVGPLSGIFPFRQVLDAGVDVKDYWEASSGAPPWRPSGPKASRWPAPASGSSTSPRPTAPPPGPSRPSS